MPSACVLVSLLLVIIGMASPPDDANSISSFLPSASPPSHNLYSSGPQLGTTQADGSGHYPHLNDEFGGNTENGRFYEHLGAMYNTTPNARELRPSSRYAITTTLLVSGVVQKFQYVLPKYSRRSTSTFLSFLTLITRLVLTRCTKNLLATIGAPDKDLFIHLRHLPPLKLRLSRNLRSRKHENVESCLHGGSLNKAPSHVAQPPLSRIARARAIVAPNRSSFVKQMGSRVTSKRPMMMNIVSTGREGVRLSALCQIANSYVSSSMAIPNATLSEITLHMGCQKGISLCVCCTR
ncbi:hypothetical protein EDD18DRAFT_1104482 [Armillaria luteobubalina]|uniref:Uncharacterized protein n=1 Tax=Armillaria luteobubalina TaxID=153913 RepID=A0AA39Q8N8_9AGAR|nr:hypothetical protein EDD18DRAFT_1104482 [Armillaria luteobubalina]